MTRIGLAACCAALLGIGAATPAFAAERGWYIGGGAGYAKANMDDDSIRSEVVRQSGGTSTAGAITKDEDSVLYKLFLGYSFTSFIAVEANAFWLNDFAFDAAISPAGQARGDVDYWGFSADLVAFLPLGDHWRLYGRVGGIYAETRVRLSANVPLADSELREYEPGYKFGAGVAYEFDSGVAFRGEWERYVLDDAMGGDTDVDTFTAAFLYRFK